MPIPSNAPATRDPRPSSSWAPLLATALIVNDLALAPGPPLLPIAAVLLLALRARSSARTLAASALALTLLDGAARVHRALEERDWPARARARIGSTLRSVEERTQGLVGVLESAAARTAALPETREALAGDRAALARLFRSLEALRGEFRERPALAVHARPLTTMAWSGRILDLGAFRDLLGPREDVFVVAGSVSTTLVAVAPVEGGAVRGLVTAELPIAVRRNIRNEFLSDFDRLAGPAEGAEVYYVDMRDQGEAPRPFPSLPPEAVKEEALLRSPDGGLLAAVRAAAPSREETTRKLWLHYRSGGSALACLVLLLWLAAGPVRPRLALGATGLRAVLLFLGPPLPAPDSPLLSADTYGSTLLGSIVRELDARLGLPAAGAQASRLLEPLLKSPLDLLLTAAWMLVLAGLIFRRTLARPAAPPSPVRALLADVLCLPLLAGVFAWLADTVANCSLDLEAIALRPRSASHLVVHVSLLLLLAVGALLLTALQTLAGPLAAARGPWLLRLSSWALVGLLAYRFWPRELIGLPLVPAVALFLLAALLVGARERWLPVLRGVSAGGWAACGLLVVALLSLLLFPSLIHFGEKNTRLQIERDHAALVLRQPQWRDYVLRETQRRIDALNVLEEAPPGPQPLGIEELAFAVWSLTDLAAFGFSSAVEIQDPSGIVVSRFALNLPSLSGPAKALPAREGWEVSRERLALASAERPVLHARRRLSYHGEVHGAIHVYVGDDFSSLPFVTGRDPYSILFRSAPPAGSRSRPVGLLVYDWNRSLAFSSAARPPALAADLVARLRQAPGGLWTTLRVDDRPHHTFLFADPQGIYGLCYPRLGAGRFVADLVEAAAALTLLALLALLLVVIVRSLLGRPSLSIASMSRAVAERFSLRLFLAFVSLAIVPAAVLQVVVRGFVAERLWRESEDQALERAAVAKKAVEDFAFFQRGQASQPVTDAALVWVASLIRNDLDVFERGRLLASSKPELYASGLLPPRVSGAVFRALLLDGQPSVLRPERIGGFEYLVVSVPVQIHAPEPGILAIPLALRQREVEAVLGDLDRTVRLASVLFLLAAGALAHSMARRISGPLRDLTRATRRIAAGDLSARVEPTSRDELRALVEAFNQMARDLDRQRRDLERSNRLAAWAEMARHVAHEVKNPLTPIQLSAEHLRRVYGDPNVDFATTLEACVHTILKQVRILRGIVTEFTAFARPPASLLEAQDLRALLVGVLTPYQAVLPPGVRLALEVGEGIPPVKGDRRLLERALVNLLENALQAVGETGSITVRLATRDSGGRVEVEVEDTGPGIDPEVREKVFEPFFSTKTNGSGLGLALVKKIAEDHGGGVALDSRPGRGTRARLWLPAGTSQERGEDL